MRIPRFDVLNLAVVALLLGAVWGANYLIDPFHLNRRFDLGLEKRPVSWPLSYADWSLAQFDNEPKPNILLGDSRTANLPTEHIEQVSGRPWANLGYGGGTSADMVEYFEAVSERVELDTIFLGLAVNLIDDTDQINHVKVPRRALDNPFEYYFRPFTTKASFQVLWYNRSGTNLASEAPHQDREAFWEYQRTVSAAKYFSAFSYSEKRMEDFARIAAWAAEHDAELVIAYMPSHADLHERIEHYGAAESGQRLRRELSRLGPVMDFDWPGSIVDDADCFKDPWHYTEAVGKALADELFGGRRWMARVMVDGAYVSGPGIDRPMPAVANDPDDGICDWLPEEYR
jgi:hypothetical protein